jgi:hypothetical protein
VAVQNTVFKASDVEICGQVTKLITNDRMTADERVRLGAGTISSIASECSIVGSADGCTSPPLYRSTEALMVSAGDLRRLILSTVPSTGIVEVSEEGTAVTVVEFQPDSASR